MKKASILAMNAMLFLSSVAGLTSADYTFEIVGTFQQGSENAGYLSGTITTDSNLNLLSWNIVADSSPGIFPYEFYGYTYTPDSSFVSSSFGGGLEFSAKELYGPEMYVAILDLDFVGGLRPDGSVFGEDSHEFEEGGEDREISGFVAQNGILPEPSSLSLGAVAGLIGLGVSIFRRKQSF